MKSDHEDLRAHEENKENKENKESKEKSDLKDRLVPREMVYVLVLLLVILLGFYGLIILVDRL